MPLSENSKSIYRDLIESVLWLNPKYLKILKNNSEIRAEEISVILDAISNIKIEKTIIKSKNELTYRADYKNLKENKDFAREDFRGAIQKYLLGFFEESIIASCNAVEIALIVRHNENLILNKISPRDIEHPFTLARNISLAKNIHKNGFITDKNIIKTLEDILNIRNMMMHQSNFLFPSIQFYKELVDNSSTDNELLRNVKMYVDTLDEKEFNEIIKKYNIKLSKEDKKRDIKIIKSGLLKEFIKDVENAPAIIHNLSDFKYFTTEKNMRFYNKLLEDFLASKTSYQMNIFYYLSNKTLKQSFIILKHMDFF
jgi:hypothetical protein